MSLEKAKRYGLHGLRVLGYNCWRGANGEDVAKLQGGWGSNAHRSYGREMLLEILQVPQRAANYAALNSLPAMPLDATDVPLLRTPSAAALPAPSGVTCSARAAAKARVTEVTSYPLASIRGPAYDAAHGSSSNWRPEHCESSMCIYDKGHDGPHSHDVVVGKRGR